MKTTLPGPREKVIPPKVKIRDYSNFSKNALVPHLEQLNWDSVDDNDVNNSLSDSVFYNKLDRVVNKHDSISKRKSKQLNKPLISRGIRISIPEKNEPFYSGDKVKYRLYSNKILTLSRLRKKLYYLKYFEVNMNNIRNTWTGINLINRKTKNENVISALKRS